VTPKAVVTDIEGTTSSIAFVHEVLFPYSRARLADYVAAHPAEVGAVLDEVRAEAGSPALSVEDCTALLLEWHDADRKIGPLKTLQGMIWAEGFAAGELQGHVYPDAAEGLRRWHRRGIPLYIYSSGSVGAQKLLFGATEYGDLTPLFAGFFDTAVGGKKEAASYRAIAGRIGLAPEEILFLSDAEAELAAAAEAGFAVTLLARGGVPAEAAFPVATSFATILPETAAA
jgi:enolase-phosphatase E1